MNQSAIIAWFLLDLLLFRSVVAKEPWSLARLHNESDLVVVAKCTDTLNTESTIDFFDNAFQQKATTFRVYAVLKGSGDGNPANSSINVVHFWFRANTATAGGFGFFAFDEFGRAPSKCLSLEGLYVLYLRKSNTGDYIPVTGHKNAIDSLFEIKPLGNVWLPE